MPSFSGIIRTICPTRLYYRTKLEKVSEKSNLLAGNIRNIKVCGCCENVLNVVCVGQTSLLAESLSLFDRGDKLWMNGNQSDGDHPFDLDDNFLGTRAFDLDENALASFE